METDSYDMEVDFFAASYFDNTLTIRLQHTGSEQAYSDGLVIVVYDVRAVNDSLGDPLAIAVEPSIAEYVEQGPAVGVPTTPPDSLARVTLYLNETCPGNQLAFTDGEGTIIFESIYVPDKEKQIRGFFSLRFVDPRDWESADQFGAHAELQGEFDFNYARGQPAQTFP